MTAMRALIVLASLAALVVLFLLVRPDDEGGGVAAPATTPTTGSRAANTTRHEPPRRVRAAVTVRAGRPVGGIARLEARKDMVVTLIVRADAADHVHVHGYDLMADVAPGRPATLSFRARLTGRFEIELEDEHRQIAELTVTE